MDKGSSYDSVGGCFNIEKSTVTDVWKAHERFKQFVAELDDFCHANTRVLFRDETMKIKLCTYGFYSKQQLVHPPNL